VFDAKAGASLTAQAVMVGEVNTALAWQADSMAATAGSMTAAASNAAAAATSATAAAGSVVSAQTQVGLAAQQAGNAASFAASAQIVAAAVGTAVGLPSVVGHGGQTLVVRTDESGFELRSLGQAIGDVLITPRIGMDVSYLLPDRIYSQSAYPELYSILGLQEALNDGSNWVAVSTNTGSGAQFTSILQGKDNVFIAVNATGVGVVRSVDGGATWSSINAVNGPQTIGARYIATDDNGVWIATASSGSVVRSVDNGLTWAAVVLPNPSGPIATDKIGNWICCSASNANSSSKSTDNGATWLVSTNAFPVTCAALECDGQNWIAISNDDPRPYAARAFDARFQRLGLFTTDTNGPKGLAAINGFVAVSMAYVGLVVSFDGLMTYKIYPNLIGKVAISRNGFIAVLTDGNTDSSLWRSFDYGDTWSRASALSLGNMQAIFPHAVDEDGSWIAAGPLSGQGVLRSVRQYNYDISTQFKVPPYKVPRGFKAFIKGKLQ
jgi:hypothetical protein